MTKNDESDELLRALAKSFEGLKLAAQSEKVDLTLKVDKVLKKRLQLVYGRNLSKLFEQAMLNRLEADGHLVIVGHSLGGGVAHARVGLKKPDESPVEKGEVKKKEKKAPVWDEKTKEFLPDDDED